MSSACQSEAKKYITFEIAGYWYAIPVTEVLKIINCPPPSQGNVTGLGIIQLGAHTIQLLDLNRIFEESPDHKISEENPFLVVFKKHMDPFFGITLKTPPDLLDIPLNVLKSVTLENSINCQNPWISHVGVLAVENTSRTILQLDLEKIFQQQLENSQSTLTGMSL